ncbi:tripartite tricarboxylate transporter substrate binding protein [Variovorax defluvii]|uniref:Tripartite tricarboxylate transporter substrate binding protein n=1 Tax=Variovorax defluvii TaxID=913761 RepID=A0ABP8HL23_9BURK
MQTRTSRQNGVTRRLVLSTPLALTGVTLGGMTLAQPRYPSKPITMVVGFPPGGSTDFIARLIAQKLSDALGQPVVVDNRGGANGLLAAHAVSASAPDGYTLLLTSMGMTTNPYLYKQKPLHPVKDFTSIAMLAGVPNVIVVNPSLPAKNLDELLALARTRGNGNRLTLATTGNAAPGHLASELLQRAAKVQFQFVPYKGSGPAITDIIAGHVDMSLPTVVATAPHIQSGKLRAIAVTGAKRSALLPHVPTIAEAGVKELSQGSGWYALIGPAGMPKEVVDRLGAEVQQIMKRPDVTERFVANGADPMYMNPADMTAFVDKDYRYWGDLIKAAAIKGEE